MNGTIKIKSALISVFHKEGLERIVKALGQQGVTIYSTGGTQSFIESQGVAVVAVEDLTSYPSILGGRVKTLHPKVFGGILSRIEVADDKAQLQEFDIPKIDLVIVDLYPFEQTVASGAEHQSIIEKIDIGGISLIRAAAKNYNRVLIVSSQNQYKNLETILANNGESTLAQRKLLAAKAFNVSSHYDSAIFNYFNSDDDVDAFKFSGQDGKVLRYGENPHQKGLFYGDLEEMFDKLHGKELSYNNLLDVDAAVALMADFTGEPTIAIMKHNNACGIAERNSLIQAWNDALAADPVSAFGGIIIANKTVDAETAEEMHKLFFEVVIAPSYTDDALAVLKQKKNRIILIQKDFELARKQHKTLLNGVIVQDKDLKTETAADLTPSTDKLANEREIEDMLFANKLVKHTKSNAIILVKNKQLLASGTGQTSRVDALNQAIEKANKFKFDLKGAVMASDAFFPFPDCVEIAGNAGIAVVIQPGGSIRDKDSVNYCNHNNMSMVTTGTRHFKH
jgi:phosphoribosylaminoimidazolecarboxamide formyltransferase/IMP cyclohydrolase